MKNLASLVLEAGASYLFPCLTQRLQLLQQQLDLGTALHVEVGAYDALGCDALVYHGDEFVDDAADYVSHSGVFCHLLVIHEIASQAVGDDVDAEGVFCYDVREKLVATMLFFVQAVAWD